MPCDHEHANGCPVTAGQKAFLARIDAQIEVATRFLDATRPNSADRLRAAEARLGAFAGERIDTSRFAGLTGRRAGTDPAIAARVDEAAETLRVLAGRIDELTKLTAAPEETAYEAAVRAVRQIGLVFGAARTIELARTGRFDPARHGRLVLGVPHRDWSKTERDALPTLRIRIDGTRLHAASLAEFLDGSLKLVLRVTGACPPAPLARLATPGVYVAQVQSPAALADFVAWGGPAVAAIVPDGAALFTHDPARGSRSWERFDASFLPPAPRRALGGISAAQQAEDLALLRELTSAPPRRDSAAAPPADPTDRLASWLLSQSGLSEDAPA